MRDLALKYRPRKLADIIGQEVAVRALTHHMTTGSNQSILLVGPSGTGKTSGGRIVGAGILCENTPPDPCGRCTSCENIFGGHTFTFGWYELDGARHSEPQHVQQFAKLVQRPHFGKFVCFLDEIHALTGSAADVLLKPAEEPGAGANFIGATTDLAAVRPALRKRCLIVPFKPLGGAQMFKLLRDVCQAEAIRYEPKALDMIASASDGSAREALNKLDQVAWQGDVTEQLVADTLAFGSTAFLVDYFDAVLAGDLNAQELALTDWQDETPNKAGMIRDFLLYLSNFEVAVPALSHIVNPAFYRVTADERRRIVRGLKFRSDAAERKLADYWLDLMDLWAVPMDTMRDHANLVIKSRRFDRMVNPEGASPSPMRAAQAPSVRKRPYRARSGKLLIVDRPGLKLAAQSDYLTLKQAEAIYEQASFMLQEYGLHFNARIALDHAALGSKAEREAGKFLTRLTHEMGLRIGDWTGCISPLMYVHEARESGTFTEIVAHIPPAALGRLTMWLTKRMAAWSPQAVEGRDWILDVPATKLGTGYPALRMARHWALVRRLWRGVDPRVGHWGADGVRVPLLELLRVPKGDRGAIGTLASLRRIGGSASIGSDQRRRAEVPKMTLLSAFADAAWSHVDRGWELLEHEERIQERRLRGEQVERVEAEWPVSNNRIEADQREAAFARLHESWPDDPHDRRRSWVGWWS